MKKFIVFFVFITIQTLSTSVYSREIPYSHGQWDPNGFGNHRVRIEVSESAEAVWAHIPWRRRDAAPAKKAVIVQSKTSGEIVKNVVVIENNNEFADIVFEPVGGVGVYYVYYMPYEISPEDSINWPPDEKRYGIYIEPNDKADVRWREKNALTKIGNLKQDNFTQAKIIDMQSRSEFESFYPMEIIATLAETEEIKQQHNKKDYLIFTEDRKYPIRMTGKLPQRWIINGSSDKFTAVACKNEYYVFQIGFWAVKKKIEKVDIKFSDLKNDSGQIIAAKALTCFNLAGIDSKGNCFAKDVTVEKDNVQAFWVGVDINADTKPGVYKGKIIISAKNAHNSTVELEIAVTDKILDDRGDGDLWRLSRLRWLNSTIEQNDEIVAPYTKVEIKGNKISCLGREIKISKSGLPESINCWGRELLDESVKFIVETSAGTFKAEGQKVEVLKETDGSVVWVSNCKAGDMVLMCEGNMEFDGHINFKVTCKAEKAMDVKDIRLELPLKKRIAKYFMGFGRKGGYCPKEYSFKWAVPGKDKKYWDSMWIGDVDAGLQCELKGASYTGPMVNVYLWVAGLKAPDSWNNNQKGGAVIKDISKKQKLASFYSGNRKFEKDQEITFEFAFMLTPVKPLDTAKHFRNRYYHYYPNYKSVDTAVNDGANIINIHHACELNPFINYPFLANEKLSAYVNQAHDKGAKVKIYYTVRELTNHVAEMRPLRTLGDEILSDGAAGGYVWLKEHLLKDYQPAWFDKMDDGRVCAAIVTSSNPVSRWHNYYLEGYAWLLKNINIDGLYLDDVSYDRHILKRMRKIMDKLRPGSMIDLHSHRDFSGGPANQYLEFFPYIDRLWFGEAFNYDESPDFWLVEVSGIPYGLMGDMLQSGGNRWRGMIYGMTARRPWIFNSDPRPMWKFWDEFGIENAEMIGYWRDDCPVTTDVNNILATAYVKNDKTLISVASWNPDPAKCHLKIDWKKLGLDKNKSQLYAPAIRDFQQEMVFGTDDPIPVLPGKGWLFIIDNKKY